jgi:hypothetical protein
MRYSRPLLTSVALLFTASVASATPITIIGKSTGNLSTAVGELTLTTTTLTLQLTNTSPPQARITAFGFDLIPGDFTDNKSSGLDGFTANNVGKFTFTDDPAGKIPQFGSFVLDFAFLTGKNFGGGKAADGISPNNTLTFVVNGDFSAYTEAQLVSSLFVRFQRVGDDGELSDVGRGGDTPDVPEPASLALFGAGLAAVAAARRRRAARGYIR